MWPDVHIKVSVRTYEEFAKTYTEGCKNRKVAPTNLNAHSSRSHAVLIVTVGRRAHHLPLPLNSR